MNRRSVLGVLAGAAVAATTWQAKAGSKPSEEKAPNLLTVSLTVGEGSGYNGLMPVQPRHTQLIAKVDEYLVDLFASGFALAPDSRVRVAFEAHQINGKCWYWEDKLARSGALRKWTISRDHFLKLRGTVVNDVLNLHASDLMKKWQEHYDYVPVDGTDVAIGLRTMAENYKRALSVVQLQMFGTTT